MYYYDVLTTIKYILVVYNVASHLISVDGSCGLGSTCWLRPRASKSLICTCSSTQASLSSWILRQSRVFFCYEKCKEHIQWFCYNSYGEFWDSYCKKSWVSSPEPLSCSSKTRFPGSLYNHTVNLETDSKTVYYSLLK